MDGFEGSEPQWREQQEDQNMISSLIDIEGDDKATFSSNTNKHTGPAWEQQTTQAPTSMEEIEREEEAKKAAATKKPPAPTQKPVEKPKSQAPKPKPSNNVFNQLRESDSEEEEKEKPQIQTQETETEKPEEPESKPEKKEGKKKKKYVNHDVDFKVKSTEFEKEEQNLFKEERKVIIPQPRDPGEPQPVERTYNNNEVFGGLKRNFNYSNPDIGINRNTVSNGGNRPVEPTQDMSKVPEKFENKFGGAPRKFVNSKK